MAAERSEKTAVGKLAEQVCWALMWHKYSESMINILLMWTALCKYTEAQSMTATGATGTYT